MLNKRLTCSSCFQVSFCAISDPFTAQLCWSQHLQSFLVRSFWHSIHLSQNDTVSGVSPPHRINDQNRPIDAQRWFLTFDGLMQGSFRPSARAHNDESVESNEPWKVMKKSLLQPSGNLLTTIWWHSKLLLRVLGTLCIAETRLAQVEPFDQESRQHWQSERLDFILEWNWGVLSPDCTDLLDNWKLVGDRSLWEDMTSLRDRARERGTVFCRRWVSFSSICLWMLQPQVYRIIDSHSLREKAQVAVGHLSREAGEVSQSARAQATHQHSNGLPGHQKTAQHPCYHSPTAFHYLFSVGLMTVIHCRTAGMYDFGSDALWQLCACSTSWHLRTRSSLVKD